MKPISEALDVSRSHLVTSLHEKNDVKKTKLESISELILLDELKEIVKESPSYGYRRACAILNRKFTSQAMDRVNHKWIYRVMKDANLILPKHIGYKPDRKHEGKVITLRSNTRWCSDAL